MRELCLQYQNLDPVKELIPVRPVVHYMMGGVHTDIHGATPLPGLFAAGEVACVSINGANRLGSNSLPELLVFGARAGHAAAEHASHGRTVSASVVAQAKDERRRLEQDLLNTTAPLAHLAAAGPLPGFRLPRTFFAPAASRDPARQQWLDTGPASSSSSLPERPFEPGYPGPDVEKWTHHSTTRQKGRSAITPCIVVPHAGPATARRAEGARR